jgi:hypothetical protein
MRFYSISSIRGILGETLACTDYKRSEWKGNWLLAAISVYTWETRDPRQSMKLALHRP